MILDFNYTLPGPGPGVKRARTPRPRVRGPSEQTAGFCGPADRPILQDMRNGANSHGIRPGGPIRPDLRLAILRFYYWATPAFFLADALWGVSVRASFLPRWDLRVSYYGFCLACALLCHRRPAITPWIGMMESGVSLLLIALGVLLPIWGTADAILYGGDLPEIMSAGRLVNVMLSGSMLVIAFHRHQARALRDLRATI